MKSLLLITAFISSAFLSVAQTGTYIKYKMDVDAKDESMAMMESMMMGSTMEIATSSERTYAKNNMGALSVTEVEVTMEDKTMTMYMTGMMGKMAFQGNIDSLNTDEPDSTDIDLKLIDESKEILGYKCKKAVITDNAGNRSTYWYTEDIERPEGVSQMPNQIPGLCLQMEISNEMMNMTYTATDVKENSDISKYKITIPEGVDVQSFEDLENMGAGL